MTQPFLSIIIPAYNEAERLPSTLEKIDRFLGQQTYTAEVLVVENGSSDATLALAQSFQERMPYLWVLTEAQRGKGLAVRRHAGSTGRIPLLCDADLSMPIDQVNRFYPRPVRSGRAIGSREQPGSVRYGEPGYRHLIGRIFNAMVRGLVLPGIQDSQCGFKCFRGDVADAVFPLQTLVGMSFDAEVLFIARKMGYSVCEVAIDWYFDPDSRVRLVQDSLHMAFDLLKIRSNARQGLYDAQG